MNDKELIARLVAENYELRDKLAEMSEASNYWYEECQKLKKNSVQVVPQTMDETVKALGDLNAK